MREINIRESIKKRRLVPKEPLIYYMLPYFIYGITLPFVMLFIPLFDAITNGKYNYAQHNLILALLILASLFYIPIRKSINSYFAFQVFHGQSKDDNIKLAQLVLRDYKKLQIIKNNNDFVQAYLERRLLRDWGNELYMIFDGKDVLINFASLARFNLPDPFQYKSDRKFEKELIEAFTSLAADDKAHIDVNKAAVARVADKSGLLRLIGMIAWSLVLLGLISLIMKLIGKT